MVLDQGGYLQVVGLGPDDHMQAVELGQAQGAWPVAAPEEAWVAVAHIGLMGPGKAPRSGQLEGLEERTCARTETPFRLSSVPSGQGFVPAV